MSKEKSKSRGLPTRRLLIVAILLMGLICFATLVRQVRFVLEPILYFSKTIPSNQRYRLTGNSYLSGWQVSQLDAVKVPRTDSVRRSTYRKEFSDTVTLFAQITFIYYDSTTRTKELFDRSVLAPYGDVIDSDYINTDIAAADASKEGCHYINKTETMPFIQERYSCDFVGRYGLCLISVDADVLEPYVTPQDFERLIEDYIDPQMAAWDVCYAV